MSGRTVMTDEDLQSIAARAAAASKGPWRAGSVEREGKVWCPDANALEGPMGERCLLNMNTSYPHTADRVFIEHAREDVPRLLAEVERLRLALGQEEQRSREYRAAWLSARGGAGERGTVVDDRTAPAPTGHLELIPVAPTGESDGTFVYPRSIRGENLVTTQQRCDYRRDDMALALGLTLDQLADLETGRATLSEADWHRLDGMLRDARGGW